MSYYDSREWKLLRDSVVNRDRYTCQECGYRKGNKERRQLNVHHVIPRKEGGADHPENLVTLCKRCHGKMEGKRKNPRNPEDAVFEETINKLSKDTVLDIVEEEMQTTGSIYYDLFLDNPYVCSNCHEYKYTIDSEYINIETSGKDVEKIISKIQYGGNILSDFPNLNKSPVCYSCQQLDFIWSGNMTMDADELKQHAHRIREFLEKSRVNFNTDIFYDSFRQNKKNPDMQYENRKILKYAVEYSVEL